MKKCVVINEADNVAVAVSDLRPYEEIEINGKLLVVLEKIPKGHKIAIRPISSSEHVVKYGFPIGRATIDISKGQWFIRITWQQIWKEPSSMNSGNVYRRFRLNRSR